MRQIILELVILFLRHELLEVILNLLLILFRDFICLVGIEHVRAVFIDYDRDVQKLLIGRF